LRNLVKVNDHPNLRMDPKTRVIINTNMEEISAYRRNQSVEERLHTLEETVLRLTEKLRALEEDRE